MTITGPWQPLSARSLAADPLHEGVPAGLGPQLRDWIYYAALKPSDAVDRVIVRVRLNWEDPPPPLDENTPLNELGRFHDRKRAFVAYDSPTRRLLDIVDALLDLIPPFPSYSTPGGTTPFWVRLSIKLGTDHRRRLQRHLDDARSVYRVSDDGRSLVRRTDATAEAAIQETVALAAANTSAGSAATHLRRAWAALHALHPDPPSAYSHAIKAVEAASHAIIQPNHAKATLGTMLGEIRSAGHKFTLAPAGPADITLLITMMDQLWTGQTSRHGSQTPTRDETREEAETAVYLALILVKWLTAGAVCRGAPPAE